ncbi:hypothetical protein [Agrobacterium rosae]|uniref:hypothetical protein n=1 Tax=Agrobacterium rosae TaxID=1972867 RepID=UPI003B9F9073
MADYTPFPLSPWYERPDVGLPSRSHKMMAAGPNGNGGVASELLSVEQVYSLLSANDIKPFADPATKRSSKAINYTATVDDNGKIIAFTAAGLTLTLPRASFAIAAADGFGFLVSAEVGTVTITRSNTDTILGATSITLNQGETAFFFPNAAGTGWRAGIMPTYNTVARLDAANVFTQRQHWAKGTNIASAASIALPTNGNFFDITGTATIAAISTVTQAGTRLLFRATGAWTLQYNATSMILPRGVNLALAVGDLVEFVSLGSGNYALVSINKADGTALAGSTPPFASAQQSLVLGAETTLTHGLGALPTFVSVDIICVTADLGYLPGDIIQMGVFSYTNSGWFGGFQIRKDATSISIGVPATAIVVRNKTANNGQTANIAIANWRFVARAWI